MERTCLAFLAAVFMAVTGTMLGGASAQSAPKPNILLILLDDTRVADIDTLLAKGKLPNIGQLINESVEFTEVFSVSSVSAPGRTSMFTGQFLHNHGEHGQDFFFGGPPLHDEATTLQNWLRPAGYLTGKLGRGLPGYGGGDLTLTERQRIVAGTPVPLSWITQKYSTFPPATHVPPNWDYWNVFVEPYTWSVHKYKTSLNGVKYDFSSYNTPAETLHQTDFVAIAGGDFITKVVAYNQPWFLEMAPVVYNRELWPGPDRYNVCANPNHPDAWWFGGPYDGVSERPPARYMNTIWNANLANGEATAQANYPFPMPPSYNEADVSDKPKWVQNNALITSAELVCLKRRYWRRLENLLSIDDMVGYVRQKLVETNQLNNTYIILMADHGLLDGQHRYTEKLAAYEESIRVPLIIRRPGAGSPLSIDKMVLGVDLAPTIAEIAGATPNIALDGRSLLPLMADPGMDWRRVGLIQFMPGIWDAPDDSSVAPRQYYALRIAHGSQRLFVHYPTVQMGVTGELYNITADPYQLTNLYGNPANQTEVSDLMNFLNALKTCAGSACRALEESFDH